MAKGKGAAPATPRKGRAAKKSAPTSGEIQARAYEIYLERRGGPGNPLEDWVRAERELMARYAETHAKPVRVPRTPRREAA